MTLAESVWPEPRIADALHAIARFSGIPPRVAEIPRRPSELSPENARAWLDAVSAWLAIDVEPVHTTHAEVETFLRHTAPALVRVPDGWVALVSATRGKVLVLDGDGALRSVPLGELAQAMRSSVEARVEKDVEAILDRAGLVARRRARARRGLVSQLVASVPISGSFLVGLPNDATFRARLARLGVGRRVAALVFADLVPLVLSMIVFWVTGRAALAGRLDRGWLALGVVLLAAEVPARAIATVLEGTLALDVGAALKQRLLLGALRLRPDEVRSEGAGQLLGRVVESEALESAALGGGALAIVAVLELLSAGVVLSLGAASPWTVLALAAAIALAAVLARREIGRRRRWTDTRRTLTHRLIERLVGHRTRLAQERRWHDREDVELSAYATDAKAMDQAAITLSGLVPHVWTLAALAILAPFFLSGRVDPTSIAIAIGGIVLARQALRHATGAMSSVSGAIVAWEQVSPLFAAAARPVAATPPHLAIKTAPTKSGGREGVILEARDVLYRHPRDGEPVLRNCSLTIAHRDRVLLSGPSGAGKSTLAAVLAGLRSTDAGLVLAEGLDRATLGQDGWRVRVVAAPQFHENHVFSGTLAFNLLMGRSWPPTPADLADAEALCRRLGLGPLLARMPAGIHQVVGETGWQLSHGERSRVFLARALVQDPSLLILDESFAALDPTTMANVIDVVNEGDRAVLVVGHR